MNGWKDGWMDDMRNNWIDGLMDGGMEWCSKREGSLLRRVFIKAS